VTTLRAELAIVGAGVAGLAAAIEAARRGASVTVIDAGESPGGQTLLHTHVYAGTELRGYELGPALWREATARGVTLLPRTVAWGLFEDRTLGLAINHGRDDERGQLMQADAVLVATGAIDRVSVFPGSTLPGVMTATAATIAFHRWRVRPGTRAVIVGDDPITPFIGAYARDVGMQVEMITSSGDMRAETNAAGTLARVVAGSRPYDADSLILAEGMQPANELARMVGCETVFSDALGGWMPLRDDAMRTSVPWLFVAGDAAGVGDAGSAIAQGRAAATAIAESLGKTGDPTGQPPMAIEPGTFRPLPASVWDTVRMTEQVR
jgi:NADPH-dependent 2,4-dienoyl-CoA reductase/sulfur reductase-like enzyme